MSESKVQGIFLDESYSLAFLIAAYQSNLIGMDAGEEVARKMNTSVPEFFFESRANNKFKKVALESAVIFDRVHLLGLPGGISFEKIDQYDDQLIGLRSTKLESASRDIVTDKKYHIPANYVREMKKILLPHTIRKYNSMMRRIGAPEVTQACVSAAFDLLTELCNQNISLFSIITQLKRVFNEPDIFLTGQLKHNEVIEHMILKLFSIKQLNAQLFVPLIERVASEIISNFELLIYSFAFSAPFCTRGLSWNSGLDTNLAVKAHESYVLCRIAMRDEIGFAPDVNSIEDVLRLRGNKYITQFREQIMRWCETLPEESESKLQKIKHDIRLANSELKRLPKWRTVDNWFFWTQIPVSFIPVLSTVATFVGFGTHLWIEVQEKRFGWVGISR